MLNHSKSIIILRRCTHVRIQGPRVWKKKQGMSFSKPNLAHLDFRRGWLAKGRAAGLRIPRLVQLAACLQRCGQSSPLCWWERTSDIILRLRLDMCAYHTCVSCVYMSSMYGRYTYHRYTHHLHTAYTLQNANYAYLEHTLIHKCLCIFQVVSLLCRHMQPMSLPTVSLLRSSRVLNS